MKILVIDGQGGKLGRKLLEEIRKACGMYGMKVLEK